MELEAVRLRVPFEALDLATVDEFGRWVATRVPTDLGVGVLLDLADVEFVMAAGIRSIADLEEWLGDSGRTLGVVGARPVVRRVLEVCGLAGRWLVPE